MEAAGSGGSASSGGGGRGGGGGAGDDNRREHSSHHHGGGFGAFGDSHSYGGSNLGGNAQPGGNHGRGESAGSDNRNEHSSHGSLPEGFGGTENIDGTSTPGLGETQSSQNHGHGDWGRDPELNGSHDWDNSFQDIGFGPPTLDVEPTDFGSAVYGNLDLGRGHFYGDGVGDPSATFFGSDADAALLDNMLRDPYNPTLQQESFNRDLAADLAGAFTPFGLGSPVMKAGYALADFMSPPTREQLVARDFFAQNPANTNWHDVYSGVGMGLGGLGQVAKNQQWARDILAKVSPVASVAYSGPVMTGLNIAKDIQVMNQQRELAGMSAYAKDQQRIQDMIDSYNQRHPDNPYGGSSGLNERGNGNDNAKIPRSVFHADKPNSQRIAQTRRPINFVPPSGMSFDEFGDLGGVSNQGGNSGAGQMPSSTFSPSVDNGGGNIASNTPFVTMDSNNRNTLLASNMLQPNEFGVPDNLFNPGKAEDEFYKMLHSRSQLWKGGYL